MGEDGRTDGPSGDAANDSGLGAPSSAVPLQRVPAAALTIAGTMSGTYFLGRMSRGRHLFVGDAAADDADDARGAPLSVFPCTMRPGECGFTNEDAETVATSGAGTGDASARRPRFATTGRCEIGK